VLAQVVLYRYKLIQRFDQVYHDCIKDLSPIRGFDSDNGNNMPLSREVDAKQHTELAHQRRAPAALVEVWYKKEEGAMSRTRPGRILRSLTNARSKQQKRYRRSGAGCQVP
jgi:hypothetical protein